MPVYARRRTWLPALLALLVLLPKSGSAEQQAWQPGFPPAELTVSLELVVRGIPGPIAVTNAGDGTDRLFVNEQVGRIRIIKDGELAPEPFLDLRDLVQSSEPEQGLLGIAFHPNYAANGFFYVAFTARDNTNTVMRFQVSSADSDRADPLSGLVILAIPDRHPEHHNGGMLAFGPDGYLYISTGDEGSTYDRLGNAQNLQSLHGKILRIDVDGGQPYAIPADNPFVRERGAYGEIWSLGLRNPWRFSIDQVTGDLYIGDVGQDTWEEINRQPAGIGGYNFGWNQMEGEHCFEKITSTCDPVGSNLVVPIAAYDHTQGCAVIGGQVYRGSSSPLLSGHYVFSDVCSGTLWMLDGDASRGWSIDELLRTELSVTSFGEDEEGELLLTAYQSGSVFRVVANDALQRTWQRTDEPVASGLIGRTWLWGEPVTRRMLESYADSPSGTRLVQYYDKSRMEVIDPDGADETAWYVTNGLLVVELVTGRLQLGEDSFEQLAPAELPVAGDPDSPNTPTYATMEGVLFKRPLAEGAPVVQHLSRDGTVTSDTERASYGVVAAQRVRVPGIIHTIAAPFWEFMQAEGIIAERGDVRFGPLFPDPYYATGYPITEAYWVTARVSGVDRDVLVQCFQRRCLTYSPANPLAWQVEAGNVGQHYYRWRYGE